MLWCSRWLIYSILLYLAADKTSFNLPEEVKLLKHSILNVPSEVIVKTVKGIERASVHKIDLALASKINGYKYIKILFVITDFENN